MGFFKKDLRTELIEQSEFMSWKDKFVNFVENNSELFQNDSKFYGYTNIHTAKNRDDVEEIIKKFMVSTVSSFPGGDKVLTHERKVMQKMLDKISADLHEPKKTVKEREERDQKVFSDIESISQFFAWKRLCILEALKGNDPKFVREIFTSPQYENVFLAAFTQEKLNPTKPGLREALAGSSRDLPMIMLTAEENITSEKIDEYFSTMEGFSHLDTTDAWDFKGDIMRDTPPALEFMDIIAAESKVAGFKEGVRFLWDSLWNTRDYFAQAKEKPTKQSFYMKFGDVISDGFTDAVSRLKSGIYGFCRCVMTFASMIGYDADKKLQEQMESLHLTSHYLLKEAQTEKTTAACFDILSDAIHDNTGKNKQGEMSRAAASLISEELIQQSKVMDKASASLPRDSKGRFKKAECHKEEASSQSGCECAHHM